MTGITHKQAGRYMRADLDGLLTTAQSRDLTAHLDECEACRLESESFSALTARLQGGFHSRWDTKHGPSTSVMANIKSQTRRIIMSKRIDFAFNILGGAATLLVLFFVVTSVISQFQKKSTAANGTQIAVSSPQGMERLLAFTSETSGNLDIYTMHADGTGLINLTNNPAQDSNPIWSLDGKSIVFESNRTGISQIYIMNADGSDIIQITHDNAEHHLILTGDDRHNLWSPDGSRLLFVQKDSGSRMNSLFSVDINGENKILLASDTRDLDTVSWSPDGEFVGYVLWDEVQPGGFRPNIYVVDVDGNNSIELSKFLPSDEHIFTPYFWSSDGRSLIFPATNYEDHNETIHQFDPQTNVLSQLVTTKPMLYDWYDGVALGIDTDKPSSAPLLWQRPDGTSAELDIQKGADPVNCYIGKARSLHGNLVIGSYCRNDNKVSLYWTNVDGSKIEQLPGLEVPVVNGGLIGLTLSPDETFVTFNFESDDETNLYIWNIEDALKDASVQPTKLLLGNSRLRYIPSWQPVINEDIVEQKPTPEPTQTNNRLIAFVSEQDGNSEIYTARADGSDLTNITNNPALDMNPIWSPDGKHIAFESDRNGFMQVYIMDADGSNVLQITNDEATHKLPVNYNSSHNPWSPDSSQLIFIQEESGGETATLYSIDLNGQNKITLAHGVISPNEVSWSPDGKYIGYVLNASPTPRETYKPTMYVVESDGSNRRELEKLLPEGYGYAFTQYYWSSGGQSIVFSAFENNSIRQAVFELDLQTNTFLNMTKIKPILEDWREDVYLIVDPNQEGSPYVWERSDGTRNTFEASKDWDTSYDPSTATGAPCNLDFTRSPQNNFAFGVYCPNTKFNLYWTNSNGSTIEQLLTLPIEFNSGGVGDIAWSPDDRYIAFNIALPDKTDMYVLNVAEALSNSSTQPVLVSVSGGELYSIPSWQPIANDDIVEEKPTPEPTQTENRLIAFVNDKNGNAEIYTMHADGSNHTNLTNYSAHDVNPIWSPDGKHLLFESDRTGLVQIYLMNADGSNLTQITNNEGDHALGTQYGDTPNPWSPDGQKIIYSQRVPAEDAWMLYVMDADGNNKIALTNEPGMYTFLGWSPDGQKIVYQTPNVGHSAKSRIMITDVDDTNTIDGITGIDFGTAAQIQWESLDRFVLFGYSFDSEPPAWQLSRMFVTTDASVYNGFGPTIVTSNVPIVALFENTYVTEDQDALRWFAFNGSPIPMSPWYFPTGCETPESDQYLTDTYHRVSPDRKRAFVVILCGEGAQFYLENTDGTEIHQLGEPFAKPLQVNAMEWSPDGSYVIVTILNINNESMELYRFDIQEMLNNPSTKPIQLTTDGAMKYGAVWQPKP